MKYLPLLLLLISCASAPLTEEEREELEYYEQERALAYLQWKANCLSGDGVIYTYKPWRLCRGNNCIPSKWDWRYDFDRDRPMLGNSYQCVSRRQMQDILRSL